MKPEEIAQKIIDLVFYLRNQDSYGSEFDTSELVEIAAKSIEIYIRA